jgi:hypothetical protein
MTAGPSGTPPAQQDRRSSPRWPASPLLTNIIKSGAAEKFDFLLRPPAPGKYTISIQFIHWITSAVLATKTVTVTAA